jgi:transposase
VGNRRISDDLKDAALRMVNKGYKTKEILSTIQFSKSTIYRTQRLKQATGSVTKLQAIGRGRPRVFTQHDIQFLIRLARHNPILG